MPKKLLKRFMPDPRAIREHKYLRIFGPLVHDPNLFHLNRRSASGISTSLSNSRARLRASAGAILKCCRRTSTIWNPTVRTGFSAVIGSWKITPTSTPRTSESRPCDRPISSRPRSFALPLARPFLGRRPMIAIDDCVLPDPDSPTIARTSPWRTW